MDDHLYSLLNLHNGFGFEQDMLVQALNCQPSKTVSTSASSQYHSPISSDAPHSRVPDFISDKGTPHSPTVSLVTPVQTLPGVFVFTPDPVFVPNFPSTDWLPSSTPISTPIQNHLHFHAPPTWDAYHTPHPSHGNYGVEDHPTFDDGMLGPLLCGSSYQLPQEHPLCEWGDGIEKIPQTKVAETAGPMRVERSRKRQAPYRVDNDQEGAKTKNLLSQQALLSETLGYENFGHDDKVPKSQTKRKRNKSHRSDQPVAGSSVDVDRPLVGTSASHEPQRHIPTPPPAETSVVSDPRRNAIRMIRRHARLKKKEVTFINLNSEDMGLNGNRT